VRVHSNKPGIRVLGVAESFRSGDRFSVLGGVVMRADLVVDGVGYGRATVGGDDATEAVLRLYRGLGREDVNALMVSGCVLSHYNVLDVDGLARESGRPVICLTYRESSGIEGAIRARFDRPQGKIERYRRLGPRTRMVLGTGLAVYARLASISEEDAGRVVESFTRQGGFPEPVRVARLLAHAGRASLLQRPARMSATSSR